MAHKKSEQVKNLLAHFFDNQAPNKLYRAIFGQNNNRVSISQTAYLHGFLWS